MSLRQNQATTPLSELPKLPTDLKSEVEVTNSPNRNLNKVETVIKNILPTKEGNSYIFSK